MSEETTAHPLEGLHADHSLLSQKRRLLPDIISRRVEDEPASPDAGG
ncbi:hypothetical protein [Streptomyces sp. NPDC091268]